jgi:Na+/proline symporter
MDLVTADQSDPILVRRRLYARLASLGQRIGYLFLLVAMVAFGIGFALGFPSVAVTISITGLIGACIVLPPAIVAGYAVKAAEREDRQAGRL